MKPMAKKDQLFLLHHSFEDSKLPGQIFYCKDCAVVEGLLATFPGLKEKIEIQRVAYPRPRAAVVERVGEENQNLPLLILKEGDSSVRQTGVHKGHAFVSDLADILSTLSERYGIPLPHP
jgi:hypothetical protein